MHLCCFLNTSKLFAIRKNSENFAISQGSEWETAGVIMHIRTFKCILLYFSYDCRNQSNKHVIFKFKIIIYVTTEHVGNQPLELVGSNVSSNSWMKTIQVC